MLLNNLEVSIEFAHVYACEQPGKSQLLSAEIYRRQTAKLKEQGRQFSSVVLVDDINGMLPEDSKKQFGERLLGVVGKVDRLVYESELISSCKLLLKALNKSDLLFQPFPKAHKKVLFLRHEDRPIALLEFREKKFKPTCACFVAAWHLTRLGAIKSLDIQPAQYSMSILEEKYKKVEDKASNIIMASKYRNYSERIFHQFYKC